MTSETNLAEPKEYLMDYLMEDPKVLLTAKDLVNQMVSMKVYLNARYLVLLKKLAKVLSWESVMAQNWVK